MNKYLSLLKYEFKNIIKDKLTLFLLVYPLIMIVIGAYFIPFLINRFNLDMVSSMNLSLLIIIVLSSISPFITGALLGFKILDSKDENTLYTIRVTPILLKGYIIFKSVFTYILSVNASFITILGTKILSGDSYIINQVDLFANFNFLNVFIYSLVVSLFAPTFALILSSLAKNKVEGFAYMKMSGIIIFLPVLLLLPSLQGKLQYILGIIPSFWPLKGLLESAKILSNSYNLSGYIYYIIGTVYMVFAIILSYKLFLKKSEK